MSFPLSSSALPIALTMGEVAGIGIDLTLALIAKGFRKKEPFFLIADQAWCEHRARLLGLKIQTQLISHPQAAMDVPALTLPILPLAQGQVDPESCGIPHIDNNQAVLSSIEQAAKYAQAGHIAAMVTNPIHKAILMQKGFAFTGHTDFLSSISGAKSAIMLLETSSISPPLRVIPLSVHIPLIQVIPTLHKLDLVKLFQTISASMKQDFKLDAPRLALAGLNPHAGEDGALGDEEITLLTPALNQARKQGIDIQGPFPADSLFHQKARHAFDVIICCYHDQALIPLKTLDFYGGVNVTLGLDFVRTSPDHGTALSLAGTNKASSLSLEAAIRAARQIANNRKTINASAI